MLKKTIVFTALTGLALTVYIPAPAYAGKCIDHMHVGTGRGPTTSLAKKAARAKWRVEVLKHNHPSKVLWTHAENKKTTCSRQVYGQKCKARATPCSPFGEVVPIPGASTKEAGVNIDPWCKKKFGNAFKAKLVGKDARGWTCERLIVDRRPINVKDACILQYGKGKVVEAKALNWSDPYSWKCVLRN